LQEKGILCRCLCSGLLNFDLVFWGELVKVD